MITVKRSRTVSASPADVFAALSDPGKLAQLLPRVQRIEMLERHADRARLATHMSIGNGFGTIRCEGDLHWVAPECITFTVRKPVLMENEWLLRPVPEGTEVNVTMMLDLAPMLGPFAQFVPTAAVSDMLDKDLDATLTQIAHYLSANGLRERAVVA